VSQDQGCVEFDNFVGEGFSLSFFAGADFGLRFLTISFHKVHSRSARAY
jgi:hypothetical protein